MKSKGSTGKILLTTFFALLPASGCTFFGSRGCHDDDDWCDGDANCDDGWDDDDPEECSSSKDCDAAFGLPDDACAAWQCAGGACEVVAKPAGPVWPGLQTPGDCVTLTCDGTSFAAVALSDAGDIIDDENECTFQSCDPSRGLEVTLAEDGAECGGSGRVCQSGVCALTCVAQSPAVCGDEGAGEPTNDTYEGATQHTRSQAECAFLDGDDVDWWSFYGDDDSFVSNELYMGLESDAEYVEVCTYVACWNGGDAVGSCSGTPAPEGGPGNGGCCWSGKPSSLEMWWDMYCTDTGEDAGTFYISVRAPGADACEPYVLTAVY